MEKILLTDDVAAMRSQVQKAIVDIITEGLEKGSISEDMAKKMAQYVLEKIPENISYENFMLVLPRLDDEYPEFAQVVVPLMEQVEIKNKALMDGQISQMLKKGNIDEALNLTNKAIAQEKKLS